MAKKLISAGCSFIYGSELGDEIPSFSQQTYPALLAKKYDLQYDCIAYPGASNQGIAKQLMHYKLDKDCIVMVQWTFPSRLGVNLSYDYLDKNKHKTSWFDLAPNNWDFTDRFQQYKQYAQQLRNAGLDNLSNMIYKHMGNDEYFLFATKLCVSAISYHLDSIGCNYVYTTACNNLCAIPTMQTFAGFGFNEWAEKNNFQFGKHGHPLHEAHLNAAEYLQNKINIVK